MVTLTTLNGTGGKYYQVHRGSVIYNYQEKERAVFEYNRWKFTDEYFAYIEDRKLEKKAN